MGVSPTSWDDECTPKEDQVQAEELSLIRSFDRCQLLSLTKGQTQKEREVIVIHFPTLVDSHNLTRRRSALSACSPYPSPAPNGILFWLGGRLQFTGILKSNCATRRITCSPGAAVETNDDRLPPRQQSVN